MEWVQLINKTTPYGSGGYHKVTTMLLIRSILSLSLSLSYLMCISLEKNKDKKAGDVIIKGLFILILEYGMLGRLKDSWRTVWICAWPRISY